MISEIASSGIMVFGFLNVLFLPGFILLKNRRTIERFVFSPILSIFLNTILIQIHNLIFGVPLSLFPITSFIFTCLLFFLFKEGLHFKLNGESVPFIALVLLSASLNTVYLAKTNFQLTGSDISQYGILFHSWYLKEEISYDLRPYLDSGNFFPTYPGVLFTFLSLETFGFDPLSSILVVTFFVISLCAGAFYLLSRNFLDKKKSLYSTIFFVFLFNMPFSFVAGRGILAFAIGFFPLICSMTMLKKMNEKDLDWLSIIALIVACSFHPFHLICIAIFGISVLIENWNKRIFKNFLKLVLIFSIVGLVSFLPFIIEFSRGIFSPYEQNMIEYTSLRFGFEPFQIIFGSIFNDGAIPISNVFYGIGFLMVFITLKRINRAKKILITFVLVSTALSIGFIDSVMIGRVVSFPKLVYPIAMATEFSNPYAAAIMVGYSLFSPGTTNWLIFNDHEDAFYLIVERDEIEAFEYIRGNVPENSTFIIDGTGGFHYGSNGDRIFLMTSRRIFYYDIFMDPSDYKNKIDLFRRFSINPDDENVLDDLKSYNVTHIYIGPGDVILKKDLFSNSDNFRFLFSRGEVYVIKIL